MSQLAQNSLQIHHPDILLNSYKYPHLRAKLYSCLSYKAWVHGVFYEKILKEDDLLMVKRLQIDLPGSTERVR